MGEKQGWRERTVSHGHGNDATGVEGISPLISVQDKKCREIRNTQITKPRQPGELFPWAVVEHPPQSLAFSLKKLLQLAPSHTLPN